MNPHKVFLALSALALFFPAGYLSAAGLTFTVNGEDESAYVGAGDTLEVSWSSTGADGCGGAGGYDQFTVNGDEWATVELGAKGKEDVELVNWGPGQRYLSIWCWKSENGRRENIGLKQVTLIDESSLDSRDDAPVATAISPTKGPVGTRVTITGSNFSGGADIIFVGSNGRGSLSDPRPEQLLSPVNGDSTAKGVSSADGSTLVATVPATLANFSEKAGIYGDVSVVPGVYYFVIATEAGKSGELYFQVTDGASATSVTLPAPTLRLNRNLGLSSAGPDVVLLQTMLAKDSSVYPEGRVTGYFGALTQRAVERFQCEYGIVCSGSAETTGYGSVGPKTRLKLEEALGV